MRNSWTLCATMDWWLHEFHRQVSINSSGQRPDKIGRKDKCSPGPETRAVDFTFLEDLTGGDNCVSVVSQTSLGRVRSNKIQNSLNLQIRSSQVRIIQTEISHISWVKNINSKFDGYEGFANLLREYVNIEHYLKILKTHQRTRPETACLPAPT